LPEDASIGEAPHSAANAAWLAGLAGLSPAATSGAVATWAPTRAEPAAQGGLADQLADASLAM